MSNLNDPFLSKLKRIENHFTDGFYFYRMKHLKNHKILNYFYDESIKNDYKYIKERNQFYNTINIFNFFENNFLRFSLLSFLERFSNLYFAKNKLDFKLFNLENYKQGIFKGFFRGNILNFIHLGSVHTLANNFSEPNCKLSYFSNVLIFETLLYPLEYFKTLKMTSLEKLNTVKTIKQINLRNMFNGFLSRILFSTVFTAGIITSNSNSNLYYLSFPLYFLSAPLLALKTKMQLGNSLYDSYEKISKVNKLCFLRCMLPFLLLNSVLPLKIKKLYDSDHKINELQSIENENPLSKAKNNVTYELL